MCLQALTAAVDKNWFRVLAAVRSNDPRIYDKNVKFFDSELNFIGTCCCCFAFVVVVYNIFCIVVALFFSV